jgi:hypothetical protein
MHLRFQLRYLGSSIFDFLQIWCPNLIARQNGAEVECGESPCQNCRPNLLVLISLDNHFLSQVQALHLPPLASKFHIVPITLVVVLPGLRGD